MTRSSSTVTFSFKAFLCKIQCGFLVPHTSLEVSFPFSAYSSRSLLFSGLPHLIRSTLKVFTFSVVYSSRCLSDIFQPETLLGLAFRAFSFKRLVSLLRDPYPLTVGCFTLLCDPCFGLVPITSLQFGFRVLYPFEARSCCIGG